MKKGGNFVEIGKTISTRSGSLGISFRHGSTLITIWQVNRVRKGVTAQLQVSNFYAINKRRQLSFIRKGLLGLNQPLVSVREPTLPFTK